MRRLPEVLGFGALWVALVAALTVGCGAGGVGVELLAGPGRYECYAYIPAVTRDAEARQTGLVLIGETATAPTGYALPAWDVTAVLSRQGSTETRTYTTRDGHLVYAELTPGVWDLTVAIAGYPGLTVTGLLVLPETTTVGLTPPAGAVLAIETPEGASTVVGGALELDASISVNHALVAPCATPPLTWLSGNPSVATVDASGVVTGVSPGSATITCSAGAAGLGVTDSVEVTVVGSGASSAQVAARDSRPPSHRALDAWAGGAAREPVRGRTAPEATLVSFRGL